MLGNWLTYKRRESCTYKFSVIDAEESCDINDDVLYYLAEMILSAHVDPDIIMADHSILRADLADLGLDFIAEILADYLPKDIKTRVGNFGETLAAYLLIEFEGFWFPIYKLRYREKKEWAMRLTDLCMIHTNEGAEPLLCFGEVKTNSSRYHRNIGVEGHKSLSKDNALSDPEILKFIGTRLYEAQKYDEYQFITRLRRGILSHNSRHDLFLILDRNSYKEEILDLLNNHELDGCLVDFSVKIILIKDLRNVIDEAYSRCTQVAENIVND